MSSAFRAAILNLAKSPKCSAIAVSDVNAYVKRNEIRTHFMNGRHFCGRFFGRCCVLPELDACQQAKSKIDRTGHRAPHPLKLPFGHSLDLVRLCRRGDFVSLNLSDSPETFRSRWLRGVPRFVYRAPTHLEGDSRRSTNPPQDVQVFPWGKKSNECHNPFSANRRVVKCNMKEPNLGGIDSRLYSIQSFQHGREINFNVGSQCF